MHDLTEEDLSQIWRDLYTDAARKGYGHKSASEHASHYVNALRAEKKAADDAFTATLAAAEPTLEWVRTAEEERRDTVAALTFYKEKMQRDASAHPDGSSVHMAFSVAESALLAALTTIERGDHVGAANREAVKP